MNDNDLSNLELKFFEDGLVRGYEHLEAVENINGLKGKEDQINTENQLRLEMENVPGTFFLKTRLYNRPIIV